MGMQGLIDAMNNASKQTRSDYHITIGELIEALEQADSKSLPVLTSHAPDKSVECPHSYRGYYSDLALEPSSTIANVETVLNFMKDVEDTYETGYKGGDYLMDRDVPVWISNQGDCDSYAVIDVMHNDTNVTLVTKYID